MEFIIFK